MIGREPEDQLRVHRAPDDLLTRALGADVRRGARRRQALSALALLALGWASGWVQRGLVTPAVPVPDPARAEATTSEAATSDAQVELLNLRVPEASQVEVVGSWNNWQPTPMTAADGTFFTVLHLPPGRYEYMFRVDGERWVQDPGAPLSRDDGFGRRNSILEI